MFKAEELGGRNRNCWYSTSESKGREWDLVFLTSIFSLKYYSLDISANTHFWQKSFKASRRVGRRQFQINVLAPLALGSVFSLGCLSGDSAYFDTLLSRSQRRRSFWSATGLTKRIEGLWERDWWLCRQKSHSCAQKQFRQENHDDKSFTGLLSRGEVIGIQGNLTFVFNVLGIH